MARVYCEIDTPDTLVVELTQNPFETYGLTQKNIYSYGIPAEDAVDYPGALIPVGWIPDELAEDISSYEFAMSSISESENEIERRYDRMFDFLVEDDYYSIMDPDYRLHKIERQEQQIAELEERQQQYVAELEEYVKSLKYHNSEEFYEAVKTIIQEQSESIDDTAKQEYSEMKQKLSELANEADAAENIEWAWEKMQYLTEKRSSDSIVTYADVLEIAEETEKETYCSVTTAGLISEGQVGYRVAIDTKTPKPEPNTDLFIESAITNKGLIDKLKMVAKRSKGIRSTRMANMHKHSTSTSISSSMTLNVTSKTMHQRNIAV